MSEETPTPPPRRKRRQKINAQQILFAKEYLVDLSAKYAAIRAGYSEKTAHQIGHALMKQPHVQATIQAEMDKRSEVTDLTAERVIRDIDRVRQKAENEGNYNAALKASELLGKHLQLFVEKLEVKHSGGVKINVLFGNDD
jgi:phage terminase small subunit